MRLFRRRGGRDPDVDEEALMSAVYRQHHQVVLAFIRRYVSDLHHAQDLSQETMLRAWRNIDSFAGDSGDVRSYLFAIARNLVTDAWRAEQRRPKLVADEWALARLPSAEDLDQEVDGWLVAAALEKLSPEHRTVVRELYYNGRTVKETAVLLTLPEGTVKSRAYYAVRALRAAFEEMGAAR